MRAVPWRHTPKVLEVQLGRPPQTPWRVVVGCKYGFPQVIASPSKLDNGALNPQWIWLTCPFLRKSIGRFEDGGGCVAATNLLESKQHLASQIMDLDKEVRRLRAEEGEGIDHAFDVGLAGSADPLKVKCIHAHVAHHLAGLKDPIGREYLKEHSRTCADRKCLRATDI